MISMLSENENTLRYFEYYEKRFSEAIARMPARKPWSEEGRREIAEILRKQLAIKDEYIPEISVSVAKVLKQDGFSIQLLKAQSWEGVCGSAFLYLPDGRQRQSRLPFVIICNGHDPDSKLGKGYQSMARRLVRQGAAVLAPDNIGQGERKTMGHTDEVIPFACGLSIQGLIVMETMAWIKWALDEGRADPANLAVVGNSGGGTLALLLGGLCPEITALSPSGYPSTFEYIARKEKKHCHCNILPGFVGRIEMWEVLGTFAPKPLFIFQGADDNLFSYDGFYSIARKIKSVYKELGAENMFRHRINPGLHPWSNVSRYHLAVFLAQNLGITPAETLDDDTSGCLDPADPSNLCYGGAWPGDALTLDELAVSLTGVRPPDKGIKLYDVYKPPFDQDTYIHEGFRGDIRQVFAQYEAFLG